jgi:hypothetical protein
VAVAAAECLSSVLNKSPFFEGRHLGNIMSAILKKAKLIICNNVAEAISA